MTDLENLIERVRRCRSADNRLDVEIEVAAFQPGRYYDSVRPNAAGTKLIYLRRDGSEETCLAWDWTLNSDNRAKALSALSQQEAK